MVRALYHNLPLPEKEKWRLREWLYPILNILMGKAILWRSAKNLLMGITAVRDTQREKALQEIINYLADHAYNFGSPVHWIALPFLATGGAEKVAMNQCRALRELHPNHSVALLITDSKLIAESPFIPDHVALIVFDDYLSGDFSYPRKEALLRELLLAAKPLCFHNINSEVAWHLIMAEGKRLSRIVPLFASIFAFQFAPDGQTKIGYAAYFLKKCMPYLTGLLSDNQRFIDDAAAEYGFGSDVRARMHVLYQPCTFINGLAEVALAPPARLPNERPQILWAGRLDAEKRIDLFLDVVRHCSFADFRVFGQVVLDDNVTLPALPNLSYEGPFSSPLQWCKHFNFDAFLFTSKWEGMPNILLEAAALSIPIIAPIVGGVREVISNETGFPLPERPTVEDYECALRTIVADHVGACTKAERLRLLLKEQHSWSRFLSQVATLPGYTLATSQSKKSTNPFHTTDNPLVSVIVPCYNQGRYLYACVTSILAACLNKLEIIIVDDGSTDPKTDRYLKLKFRSSILPLLLA